MLETVDPDIYENDELKHWGIIGMHWGIRRFQNEDGSLTPEGRIRYGVNKGAEAMKLSYSKEYSVLKQKQNRTQKENEKFKRLDSGRKHFEKALKDPDYWNKLGDDLSTDKLEYASRCFEEYYNSTNYGKGVRTAQILGAVPLGAIGLAADTGAVFVESHFGMPVVTGLFTTSGIMAGLNIGTDLYEKKYKNELENEFNNKYVKSYEKKNRQVKNPEKELGIFKTELDNRRKKEAKERIWSGDSVSEAARRTSLELSQDEAYAMVFSNPQYYLKDGQWSYDGKTFGSVDGLINAIAKNM